MDQIESLALWAKENLIDLQFVRNGIYSVDGINYMVLDDHEKVFELFESKTINLALTMDEEEKNNLEDPDNAIKYVLFRFGSKWYYSLPEVGFFQFNLFKFVGKANTELLSIPHLGIHGPFELCNGSRLYSDWCKKAKFLGVKALGICEENTLAGALNFQNAVKKAGLDFVIGATAKVKENLIKTNLKFYVQDEVGWKNLLNIVNKINVDNNGEYVDLDFVCSHTEGLHVIIESGFQWDHEGYKLILNKLANVKDLYYQIDPVEWSSQQRDSDHLNSIKSYLKGFRDRIKPILICDSYYIDQSDSGVKKLLNKIGKNTDRPLSKDQYFKPFDKIFHQFEELFKANDTRFEELLEESIYNLEEIVNSSNFEIIVGEARLPKYEMNNSELELYNADNEEMFFDLLEKGFEKKVVEKGLDINLYTDRINEEVAVIKEGGFIDYFLILADIVNFCDANDIMVGIGRGSAAGSLVSYCLGIVGLDPIKYNLLFSRFLNSGRIHKKLKEEYVKVLYEESEGEFKGNFKVKVIRDGQSIWIKATDLQISDAIIKDNHAVIQSISKEIRERVIVGSLPDIDSDFPGNRRADIKKYLETKYGIDRVTSIGTYGTFKMKAAIQDVGREMGIDAQTRSYVTAMVDAENSFMDLFLMGIQKPMLKQFIKHNPELIETTQLIMDQPKNASIHAAGVVIVPNTDAQGNKINLYDQMPVKLHNGLIVSEWEGPLIEQAGFLKCDILGTRQLEKLTLISKLIKQNKGVDIDLLNLDLELPEAYELFSNGFNEDVFQMGGAGLKGYCKKMKPENIEDCIATVALYRPGPMDIGAHERYASVKNGKEDGKADFGTDHIVEKTYYQIIYQEQVMQICVDLAGFTPNEADEVRKAMGKKIQELLDKYKEIFVTGAMKNGCPEQEARDLWEKIEKFAGYAFNRSHAACYAMTAYQCQWLKASYPLEFWTVALGNARDYEIPGRISELRKTGGIQLSGVNINNSQVGFYSNIEKNTIYWSLTTVKHVGDVAVAAIMADRAANGQYFSLEEFVERIQSIKKSGVNKRHITNLILSGAFDDIENITDEKQRLKLLKQYYSIGNVKITPVDKEELTKYEKMTKTEWILLQNYLSGYGFVDFKKLFETVFPYQDRRKMSEFVEETELPTLEPLSQIVTVAGVLQDITERTTKKGTMGQLEIKANTEITWVTMWPETYAANQKELKERKGDVIFIDGQIRHDGFKDTNILVTTDSSVINFM